MSLRRRTAIAVIEAYNDWSLSAIMSLRDPSCTHEILPRSLGRPVMDNEAYEAYFKTMMKFFQQFHVTVNDVFEDEHDNKIIIWAKSTADSVIGPYANEYMLAFYFNEAGTKVTRFLEFVDSANSLDFFPRLREFLEQRKPSEDGV